jgi:hypothetical protein
MIVGESGDTILSVGGKSLIINSLNKKIVLPVQASTFE